MAAESTFNAQAYFKALAEKNKLAIDNDFKVGYCSGPDGINDVLQEFRTTKNFILIDDTTSQNTYSHGVTFFDRNVYTVFILAGYRIDDMEDRQEKLELCRRIFRQFHSRLIRDQASLAYGNQLSYLDVQSVLSKEFPRYSLNGVTGLLFMVNNEEPVDLTYEDNDWIK
mgnify:CR=1 FL=1